MLFKHRDRQSARTSFGTRSVRSRGSVRPARPPNRRARFARTRTPGAQSGTAADRLTPWHAPGSRLPVLVGHICYLPGHERS
jgi:hypothetical protein